MYIMTREWSLLLFDSLEKVIQLGWFGVPTMLSPSLLLQMNDQGGSWMTRMLKSILVLKCYPWGSCSFEHFAKEAWDFLELYLNAAHSWANWLVPGIPELLILLSMPFPIEAMSPEWARIWIGLMVTFTVQAFEYMRAWFPLFGFKTWKVGLKVHFTAPSKVAMMFSLVGSITFNTTWTLDITCKIGVSLFLAILALKNTRVYVSTSYSSNVTFYIEAAID